MGDKWYHLDLHQATSEWSFHRPSFVKRKKKRQSVTKNDSNALTWEVRSL